MEPVQLPYEILLHISAFSSGFGRSGSSLLQQLMLHRPFYEYYTACRQYCIQIHTVITTGKYRTVYTVFGKRHREDGPAVTCANANSAQFWFLNNKLHRANGPAISCIDGHQEWYCNGKRGREDGPAIICADGTQEWYQNGKRHREDGPAVIWPSGKHCWYLNGLRQRRCEAP